MTKNKTVITTDEIQSKLSEPMPYHWRVQSINERGAALVAYIDARDAMDRLDLVMGLDGWNVDYKEIKGHVYAGVGLKINNEWVIKWDCGSESNIVQEKGEASDAFKRACVRWGIGRFLYSLPQQVLKVSPYTNKKGEVKYYPSDDKGNILWSAEDLNNYMSNKAKPASERVNSQQMREENNKTVTTTAEGSVERSTVDTLFPDEVWTLLAKFAEHKHNEPYIKKDGKFNPWLWPIDKSSPSKKYVTKRDLISLKVEMDAAIKRKESGDA